MSPPDGGPTAPDELSRDLIEEIDALEAPALRALSSYVDQRLAASHKPIVEQIREEATGEIVDIEDRGPYTLVRMRAASDEDGEKGSQTVSVYHVTQEMQLDGEVALHWSFIGEVNDQG